jgi:molybdopterin converting factor subunit 1
MLGWVMKIRVKLFAALQHVVGHEELEVELVSGKTAGELLDLLVAEHPKLARYLDVIQVAVNQEFVGRDEPIAADDEVALLPPVSGG